MTPAKTKTCPACKRTLHRCAVMCHCGEATWPFLSSGFHGTYCRLIGQVPVEKILPLINIEDEGLWHKTCIQIKQFDFDGDMAEVRIRKEHIVFKRQPCCVGCGVPCVKCLLINRNRDTPRCYNLLFLTADNIPLTIDHIVPIANNGLHRLNNLQTMCYPCNSDKGNMSFEEYKQKLEAKNASDIQTG